ncbi:S8 family serine peptidase [Streptomyces sp. B1866]|uniref:S8 family serine peptidase n=1 Tax=Streptomyces sp. B1866 TaxID=3075431 RepID=UPI00288E6DD6|nr:S8 family serine peptidase [Streptomyces sp. B1866]MDT3395111.1 S8 family serine peptidase [Streptomyces sp. B1866]
MSGAGRRKTGAAAMAVASVAALAVGVTGADGAGAAGGRPGGQRAADAGRTVTLVTGDRVELDAEGRVERVTRGAGRENILVHVQQYGGHQRVIPSDAAELIRQGRLDARLFDVTALVADGYDDRHQASTPLIVTYPGGGTPAALRAPGLTVRRELPVVRGQAVSVRKDGASAAWRALADGLARQGSGRSGRSGVAKVWLDGKVRASLDRSVPQIGGPEAWAAGYTGKGVKIAVLDTGVDQTHPDLAGREVAERNFSDAEDAVDREGHGTHVASTAAGSGAKSGGRYKGVAPDAQIIDGKVLDDEGGGTTSGVLAGMEWAVAQGAKVVNMSLGSTDTPGLDPLEEAVGRLTAEKGVLFAVAAGNNGPQAGTIDSPGSAEAALTVGAVDKEDRLARFSSAGLTEGHTLKPDVTAPGVDITAARAAESTPQRPAGPGYATLSGTSMATPHAAGAAALLAQQHPDWMGTRIKQALASSAAQVAGASAYQQGTGRIDLKAAITQRVASERTSVGFGLQQWPHADDRPKTEQVAYRNDGDRPVTLDLAVQATGPDGRPAPEGAFTVGSRKLTVPAGGTATADLTADTRVGDQDGVYSGTLVATAEGGGTTTVRTAFAVEREAEAYDVKLTARDATGAPGAVEGRLIPMDRDPDDAAQVAGDGSATVRLPKGTYAFEAMVRTPGEGGEDRWALFVHPDLTVDKDTALTLDAREAEPVEVTPPDARAALVGGAVGWSTATEAGEKVSNFYDLVEDRRLATRSLGSVSGRGGRTGQRGQREFLAFVDGRWTAADPADRTDYHAYYQRRGSFYTGFRHRMTRKELARLDVTVGAPATGKLASVRVGWRNGYTGGGYRDVEIDPPGSAHQYVTTGPGASWHVDSFQLGPEDEEGVRKVEMKQLGPLRSYQPGRTYPMTFNVGVFGPDADPANSAITRSGDALDYRISLFSDSGDNYAIIGWPLAQRTVLTVDGKVVADEDSPPKGEVAGLPPGRAAYTLSAEVTRDSATSLVSTRIAADWSFTSERPAEGERVTLPISAVRYRPELSLTSTAKAGAAFIVPVEVRGAAAGRNLKSLAVEVSYDGGKTWAKAPVTTVGGRPALRLQHPADAASVSFRSTVTDKQGNTQHQTIENAYRLVP